MKLRVGLTLVSPVETTSVVVVRAPANEVTVTCGGTEMVDGTSPEGKARPTDLPVVTPESAGTLLGKRYGDESVGIELLCTKSGPGSLAVDGVPLGQKDAKPLPASD